MCKPGEPVGTGKTVFFLSPWFGRRRNAMVTYVIGDIHGEYEQLKDLVQKMHFQKEQSYCFGLWGLLSGRQTCRNLP